MAPVPWHDHEVRSSLLAILLLAAGAAIAQPRTVWDGAYTDAQANRGRSAFAASCAGCHSLTAEGRAPLAGDAFWKSFSLKTVGEVLDFVTRYMPNGAPRSLSSEAYADIVALMLQANGLPAGTTELADQTVAEVQIIPKDGSTILPANALIKVVGCLTRSGTDWAVKNATAPERAERVVPGRDDATRPLGTRTMALKFLLTKLDALAGARVTVSGLQMGTDGVDGINVTGVTRVAPNCP
jgi:mono/diheme cytochrome c family protein